MMKFALWNTLIKNFDHVVTQDRSSAFLICMPYLCYLVPPSLEFVKGSVLDVSYETETTCTWQWPLYWMKWILRRVWWLLVIWQSLTCYFPKKNSRWLICLKAMFLQCQRFTLNDPPNRWTLKGTATIIIGRQYRRIYNFYRCFVRHTLQGTNTYSHLDGSWEDENFWTFIGGIC